jgi:hypothetical protein
MKLGSRLVVPALALWGMTLPGQVQDATEASGTESAARLAKMHEAWGPKASTPKTSLTITESSRSGKIIRFRLHTMGLPKDGVYSLVSWPITGRDPAWCCAE